MGNIKTFKDIPLKHTYSSLDVDLVDEVVSPILAKAFRYDRGVGYFTSGWLKEAAKGLLSFVNNGGKARIITSPILSVKDWEVIKNSTKDTQVNPIIRQSIEKTFDELEKKLEWDTLAALAWLIRDGVLEFRFAIPVNRLEGGMFHSKLSIFYDFEGNGLALHGSQNDSSQASLNEETLSVFRSWDEGKGWFDEHQKWFEDVWNKKYTDLKTIHVSEADKIIITKYADKLPRPYSALNPDRIETPKRLHSPAMNPNIVLRDYQDEAIEEWMKNEKKGIFEMATGSGKTITAISAAVKVFQAEGRIAIIVLVPYIHLVDQWEEELRSFGFSPKLCYQSVSIWKEPVAKAIREYNSGLSKHICLVSTHATASASSQTFLKLIKRLFAPCLLIGDEIHGLGAPNFRKSLTPHASWRIGLSATPDRWHDEEGSSHLREYFGKTVIDYDLDKAIADEALTSYLYYPEKIDLTEEEAEEYSQLSTLIAQLSGSKKPGNKERVEALLRKRADVIGKANEKIPRLLQLLKEHWQADQDEGKTFQHLLIYCNKGTHKEVLEKVSSLGLRVHEFVHDVSLKKRKKVLRDFSDGKIDALIAIRCLDEGVDVPATRRAYILASSTNPREFVQRRGRILRKSPGKQFAIIHDFIVGPWETNHQLNTKAAKSLLLRELPRFAEFSLGASNSQEARDSIWETIERLNLVPYLRKKPWEVYQELKQKRQGNCYG